MMARSYPEILLLFEHKIPATLTILASIILIIGLTKKRALFKLPSDHTLSLEAVLIWLAWPVNQVLRLTVFIYGPLWFIARTGIFIREFLHESCQPSPSSNCYIYWLLGSNMSTMCAAATLGLSIYLERKMLSHFIFGTPDDEAYNNVHSWWETSSSSSTSDFDD